MSGPSLKIVKELTAEYLRNILHYEPLTGVWLWKQNMGCRAKTGYFAGSYNSRGYLQIQIHRKKYKAHRLAFLYMLGKWPIQEIDHKTCDPKDCRWQSLREATRSQNMANACRPKHNSSGLKGAYFHKKSGRWYATIGVQGINIHLGSFASKEAAHIAYVAAAQRYFGEFAHA